MKTLHRSLETWNGINRRDLADRRKGRDRRNLVRFESLGCDRRLEIPRRRSEMLWEKGWILR